MGPRGWSSTRCSCPAGKRACFPHQRALDEGGRAGLEEERRLAYVGLTRAKQRAHIWFVSNRRIHGMWQSTIPSRFLDELPAEHVQIAEAGQNYGGYGHNAYGASRFDKAASARPEAFSGNYCTPGWQRAQAKPHRRDQPELGHPLRRQCRARRLWRNGFRLRRGAGRVKGRTIDGELIAKSVSDEPSRFAVGDRVFHIKFGNGSIAGIEGNKLTIDFDKAGQKRVLDGFVAGV